MNEKFVEHDIKYGKVLEYKCNLKEVTWQVVPVECKDQCNTNWLMLLETSKLFDPFCLTLPINIRGKLLMKSLRENKREWDEKIESGEVLTEWERLKMT